MNTERLRRLANFHLGLAGSEQGYREYCELCKLAIEAADLLDAQPAPPATGEGDIRDDIGLCAASVVLAYYRKTHDHILQDDDTLHAALRVEKYLGRR